MSCDRTEDAAQRRDVSIAPARRRMALALWVALAGPVLAGCMSLPGAKVGAVDGRDVELAVTRHDTVPVVFENGLGGQMAWWRDVLAGLSPDTTTLAYNRPGYGQSSLTDTPRDGLHVVEELRAVLRAQGLSPPYVLVGHSLGGLYMQLFARRYPQETFALVLVDSTHPRQLEGDGAIEKHSLVVRGLLQVLVTGIAREELRLLPDTGRQVLDLPTPADTPVFVISASRPLADRSPAADDANAKRRDIARLYPGSRQVWVDSGHAVPLERPDAIVAVVREALASGREASPAAAPPTPPARSAASEPSPLHAPAPHSPTRRPPH